MSPHPSPPNHSPATRLTLATRGSALALTQARLVARAIATLDPLVHVEELELVTTGDRIQDRPLQDVGGKGLFVKEIELALLERRAELAVHSVKDLPAELAEGLVLAAVPAREDPRDVLVSATGAGLDALPRGARIGTSSLRRKTQLLALRPDLDVVPLRGNVDTRLRKVREGQVDATLLALAGLRRLGLESVVTEVLAPSRLLPAVGQGALGIECRADRPDVYALLGRLDDPTTRICVAAERAFMAAVEGSCRKPLGALGERVGDRLRLSAMLAEEDCSRMRRAERSCAWPSSPAVAEELGRALGAALRGQ
jgi:hydroxymethylbilane synthase